MLPTSKMEIRRDEYQDPRKRGAQTSGARDVHRCNGGLGALSVLDNGYWF